MTAPIAALVFLPVLAVWVLALHDVLTRRDIPTSRRVGIALALLLVFPLTILYVLARPPSTVRTGPATAGDPRTALVNLLDSRDAAAGVTSAQRGELTAWVAAFAGVEEGGASSEDGPQSDGGQ